MSAHRKRPSANQVPAAEVRVLDPGGQQLTFTWQVLGGHGHLLATGQVAGAPNTAELAGWRYHAFAEAAQAAIAALQDLEATRRRPGAGDHDRRSTHGSGRVRSCDFCAAAPAAWRYPARVGQLATVLIGDALVIVPGGDWHACPACHDLVQAGQWDALSARARLPGDQGAALWATFQAGRPGTPTPLDPHGRDDRDGGASR
ncbi:MAG TPA: hypothetical protein VGM21_05610 [Actinomycetota bacterium]|jgi:hypothetical protein